MKSKSSGGSWAYLVVRPMMCWYRLSAKHKPLNEAVTPFRARHAARENACAVGRYRTPKVTEKPQRQPEAPDNA